MFQRQIYLGGFLTVFLSTGKGYIGCSKKAIYHTEISLQLRKGKTPWVKGIEILACLLHSAKQRHSLASRSNQCKPSLNSDLPHTINSNRVVARAYLNVRVKIIHNWFECINQMFWHVMS